MNWIFQLHATNPTAHAIALLAFVCVLGMAFGGLRFRGIKLGTSGVLFAGLFVGHFTNPLDHHTLEFVKEFGLILFVFCIGLQLGPGFFSSLRQSGLRLNALALAIVVLGAGTAVVLGWGMKLDDAAVLGVLTGSTTNTPSLGAAQQTLSSLPGVPPERAALPALAYAVTYPVGILGIIGTLLFVKSIYRIDVPAESAAFLAGSREGGEKLHRRTIVVENPTLQEFAINEIPEIRDGRVVVSRIRRADDGTVRLVAGSTHLLPGDRLHAVGTISELDRFQRLVGGASSESLLELDGDIRGQKVVLTKKGLVGKTLQEISLPERHGVVVTTVMRGEVEVIATGNLELRYGDVLQIVGPHASLDLASKELGNAVQKLNETQFIPLFAGIAVGILLGTLPIPCPGLPQPLKLGLAGGPLIVALIVGRVGRIGRLVWYMPRNANLAFRELGIALFFASVGLLAGPTFFNAACSLDGLKWLAAGSVVTIAPLLLVAVCARKMWSMNFVELSGLLAGSMTDPPALAFASGICQAEAPAVAYAAVYPLTMLLRIMVAQGLTVILCG